VEAEEVTVIVTVEEEAIPEEEVAVVCQKLHYIPSVSSY